MTATETRFPYSGSSTIEEERLHRKQRLAATFRIFSARGLDEGVAGHISARDPEHTDHYWVNPFALDFGEIRVSDLVLVDDAGHVVEGTGRINPAVFAIHGAVHAARPDVVCVAHSHSPFGKAWSTLGRPLDPITQDHCDFYEDHGLYSEFNGAVRDLDEGRRIADALGATKAVILRNHGLLTVGHSVDEAAWWFLRLERCCQIQLAAEAAGTPLHIDDAAARQAYAEQGSHGAGWFTFQPLYRRIVRDQPDLLE